MDRQGAVSASETFPACSTDDEASVDASGAHGTSLLNELSPSAGRSIALSVENMHCGSCQSKVETALAAVPGVISVKVDLPEKRATAFIGEGHKADAAMLVKVLAAAGFNAAGLAPETVVPAPAAKGPAKKSAAANPSGTHTITLAVENMVCGGCMRKVEAALTDVPGVVSARANLSAKRATVVLAEAQDAAPAKLIDALGAIGFRAAELAPETIDAAQDTTGRSLLSKLAVAGFAAMNIMLFSVSTWAGSNNGDETHELFHWISAIIAVPAVAYSGTPFFSSAWQALKRMRVNMDVPISLAIGLSTAMSVFQTIKGSDQVYFDAGVSLLFFLLIGRYLDQRVRVRARGAAENLLSLKAQWAYVIGNDGSIERLPSRLVEPGMRLAVAAGERFPADGVIASGTTTIDESLITGETLPREAGANAAVYAGSVNLGAPVEMEARAAEADTLLAQIARLMETAEQARGRYVRLADRAAQLYAPLVHTLAALSSWAG